VKSRLVWAASLGLAAAAGAGTGLAVALVARELPDVALLDDYRPPLSTRVVDRHGERLGEFFEERRQLVALDGLPRHLIEAFLASEDSDFFEHAGLDLSAMARAAWVNLRAGGVVQGGSTITQQLAKSLLPSAERTLWRKLQDTLLALRIEARLPKERILEIYLNQIYFGEGAYGVSEAARSYFAKDAAQLDLAEAALLAGLPKAPSAYSPRDHPESAEERRLWVLEQMVALGFIDEATQRAAAAPPQLAPATPAVEPAAAYAVEEVRRRLFQELGADAVLRGGLRVETTLDAGLQRAAHAALRSGLEDFARRHARKGAAPTPPAVEGALVALEAESGDLLALVGGYDFARSQFNRALQARRQPGSAFKTFVYGAALAAGFQPSATVYDYQFEYVDEVTGKPWRPRNFKEELLGEVSLREAFARSLNNATVRLLEELGIRRASDFARRAGIRSPLAKDLGIALGTSEVTLLEITSAYGTFAAGGRVPRARAISRVLDRDGRVLLADLAFGGEGEPPAGISAVDAYLVTDLLRASVQSWYGTGHSAAALRVPLAGKTGSTNEYRDAWFIGYSPAVVAGVWVGRDDRSPLGRRETGARAALPIWMEFMRAAVAVHPTREFRAPPGVEFTALDPVTGELRRSTRPLPGFSAVAVGRPPRESRYVPPPLPDPALWALPGEPLPAVGAGPPPGIRLEAAAPGASASPSR
jgi:penicillin-binding protein 1A